MKQLLLIVLLLIGISAAAQDTISDKNCLAQFKYSLNTEIMTLVPSTVFDFHDRSEGDIISWNWDFGDGNNSTLQNPTHTYVHPIFPDGALVKINPYRTVTLSIVTANGCSVFYSETINIYDPFPIVDPICEARFKYYQSSFDSINQLATIQFDNYSIGENLTYLWDFGDGLTSTEFAPQLNFDLSRNERKVCLTVSNENGCAHTICDPVYVYDNGGQIDPYENCFADFWFKVNTEVKPFVPSLVLDFYAKVEGEVVKYLWDFGDGYTSNEANPMHIFNYPLFQDSVNSDFNPFREVCLTITTASGCEYSMCHTIDIYMNTDPVETCYAYFKYDVPEDVVTESDMLAFKFFPVSDKEIAKIEWRFADGTISNDLMPVKTFILSDGKTEVCLTVTTDENCSSQLCEVIYFNPNYNDTTIWVEPVCDYKFRFTSSYPATASSCIGKVKAEVVLNDVVVKPDYVYWSTGEETSEINNLCPTQIYTVTARVNNECKFSSSFIFNSNGTVTEIPINWWITNDGYNSFIEYDMYRTDYTVEWILCDGSVYYGNNVPLGLLNCGPEEANLILKDALGNVVYTEKVAVKGTTGSNNNQLTNKLIVYPIPAENLVNLNLPIEHSFTHIDITDISGRVVLKPTVNLKSFQQQIDISTLNKGIYVVRVLNNGKLIAKEKFMK